MMMPCLGVADVLGVLVSTTLGALDTLGEATGIVILGGSML